MPFVAEDQNVAEELARHPRWRWIVGMALVWDAPSGRRHRSRVVTTGEDWGHCHLDGRLAFVPDGAVPDLGDDATAGVLLGVLWLADADPEHGWHAHHWPGRGYVVHASESRPELEGATFGEAVARALLAAWSGAARVEGRQAGRTQEPPREQPDEADGVLAAAIAWAREPSGPANEAGAGRALLVVENPVRAADKLIAAGLVLGPLMTAGYGSRAIRIVGADVTGNDLLGDLFAAVFLGVAVAPRVLAEIRRRVEIGGDLIAAGSLPDGDGLWTDIESAASRVVGEASPGPTAGGPGPATRALLEQLTARLTDGVVAEVEESGVVVNAVLHGRVAARVAAVLAGAA